MRVLISLIIFSLIKKINIFISFSMGNEDFSRVKAFSSSVEKQPLSCIKMKPKIFLGGCILRLDFLEINTATHSSQHRLLGAGHYQNLRFLTLNALSELCHKGHNLNSV